MKGEREEYLADQFDQQRVGVHCGSHPAGEIDLRSIEFQRNRRVGEVDEVRLTQLMLTLAELFTD